MPSLAGDPCVRRGGVDETRGGDEVRYDRMQELLARAESDGGFREALQGGIAKAASLFDPRREIEAWADVLEGLKLRQEA